MRTISEFIKKIDKSDMIKKLHECLRVLMNGIKEKKKSETVNNIGHMYRY